MAVLLHICSSADWQAALRRGEYRPDSLAAEGFIHASTAAQVVATAARFYGGRRDLVLLLIDAERVAAPIRREAADGGLFPHIYGPLALDAVTDVVPFAPGADGLFHLPGEAESDDA